MDTLPIFPLALAVRILLSRTFAGTGAWFSSGFLTSVSDPVGHVEIQRPQPMQRSC